MHCKIFSHLVPAIPSDSCKPTFSLDYCSAKNFIYVRAMKSLASTNPKYIHVDNPTSHTFPHPLHAQHVCERKNKGERGHKKLQLNFSAFVRESEDLFAFGAGQSQHPAGSGSGSARTRNRSSISPSVCLFILPVRPTICFLSNFVISNFFY